MKLVEAASTNNKEKLIVLQEHRSMSDAIYPHKYPQASRPSCLLEVARRFANRWLR